MGSLDHLHERPGLVYRVAHQQQPRVDLRLWDSRVVAELSGVDDGGEALREHIERLRRYATLLETTKGAVEEQAERWRKSLIELQGYADA